MMTANKKKPSKMTVIIYVVVLMLLSGCENKSFTHEFRQDQANIKQVEICSYEHAYKYIDRVLTPIVKLSDEDSNALLNDIRALDCHEDSFPLDTPRTYGDVVICITYYDGETEVIGITNIGYISPDGKWHLTKEYFDIEDIRSVINKYVDPEILSEISD